jgi:DNA/RNA endonuclease YhcR with UshA esterase domain
MTGLSSVVLSSFLGASAMRLFCAILVLTAGSWALADEPISVAEAAKRVDAKVTIKMEVKSSAAIGNCFLNSESNFRDEKNFTVFIAKDVVEKFKKAKIEDPAAHYKGKTILVTGTVTLFQKKLQIKIEEPEQIKIEEEKK